jgi:hypothetical protein
MNLLQTENYGGFPCLKRAYSIAHIWQRSLGQGWSTCLVLYRSSLTHVARSKCVTSIRLYMPIFHFFPLYPSSVQRNSLLTINASHSFLTYTSYQIASVFEVHTWKKLGGISKEPHNGRSETTKCPCHTSAGALCYVASPGQLLLPSVTCGNTIIGWSAFYFGWG